MKVKVKGKVRNESDGEIETENIVEVKVLQFRSIILMKLFSYSIYFNKNLIRVKMFTIFIMDLKIW